MEKLIPNENIDFKFDHGKSEVAYAPYKEQRDVLLKMKRERETREKKGKKVLPLEEADRLIPNPKINVEYDLGEMESQTTSIPNATKENLDESYAIFVFGGALFLSFFIVLFLLRRKR